jgi:hypothetical protein
MHYLFILLSCLIPLFAALPACADLNQPDDKTVLIAILARNKAHVLPKYLQCIEELEYDKSLISLYINTNNNIDETEEILEEWLENHSSEYRSVVYEPHQLKKFDSNKPHVWTPKRFKVLAEIRNKSLQMTKELECDYYFVVDCDNFIEPFTLKILLEKDKPIIAPMLYPIPEKGDIYSNYFCAVSSNGYYKDHPDYLKLLKREKVGTFKVPVVHCTYLINADLIDQLNYIDETEDYEFVIFSRCARKNKIDQYLCNEFEFGEMVHFFDYPSLNEETRRMQEYFE